MSAPENVSDSLERQAPGKPRAWWRKLRRSQERLSLLVPLFAVLLLVAIIAGSYLLLRMEERAREQELVLQESQFLALRLSEQLLTKQDDLQRLVHGMVAPVSGAGFDQAARALLARDGSLYAITWFDARQRVVSTHHTSMLPSALRREAGALWQEGALSDMPQGHWVLTPSNDARSQSASPSVLRLFTPIQVNGQYLGTVLAEYAPHMLLHNVLRGDNLASLAVALVDAQGTHIAGVGAVNGVAGMRWDAQAFPPTQLSLPISPLGDALQLKTTLYRTDRNVTRHALLVLLGLLGTTTTAMLLLNWRLSRRRLQTQRRLREESSFRLAIENSLTTGIRVLDLDGVTTYTNAAFARMVGWSQQEMIGMKAPFPYWPEKDREVLAERFQAELNGRHYPGGLQLRMRRKNGTAFDARVFMTPLRDEHGVQTGWLTTINDITEPNRIRQQLAAAHDRFTLVLESLDASITVAPLGSKELVFANRLYRQWFGAQSDGHLQMLAQAGASRIQESDDNTDEEDALMGLPAEVVTTANTDRAEIYVESLGKWLELRSRYLDWVDGRLAQMLIATDITKRKQAEEQAARQIEKMESVSRLMTMGEMASSVAHELNQPLAAISNYVNGMISRIKADTIERDQLLIPLEKTAHQAVRAGQVIHRIRSFIKRSEFNRELCAPQRLVTEALELANIEIRKRSVRLSLQLQPNLPRLHVDAILIEQVLINLLKNAAEAIDGADLPTARRGIELQVQRDGEDVCFRIIDQGPGMPETVTSQLFDAFFSTKKDGMGIGLNLCRSIIESHQGKLQVRNLYNGPNAIGCEFAFWLPAATKSPSAPAEPPMPILG
ncbi:hypothetical protein AAV94_05010 [Lampropedia cohaerens]|uniref:histidine kinase n=1 Tax=Lampropedia cohaerens TaxID=1610491 RepID=A0A0U1Q1A3_9BURK|nr:PAS domain S-box protein [Lampropedia cohaerens]KKW68530.1 hypothetical protein AAV94_05010 [Lampropedia cohaerens]